VTHATLCRVCVLVLELLYPPHRPLARDVSSIHSREPSGRNRPNRGPPAPAHHPGVHTHTTHLESDGFGVRGVTAYTWPCFKVVSPLRSWTESFDHTAALGRLEMGSGSHRSAPSSMVTLREHENVGQPLPSIVACFAASASSSCISAPSGYWSRCRAPDCSSRAGPQAGACDHLE
jgi:hypothetical protein